MNRALRRALKFNNTAVLFSPNREFHLPPDPDFPYGCGYIAIEAFDCFNNDEGLDPYADGFEHIRELWYYTH